MTIARTTILVVLAVASLCSMIVAAHSGPPAESPTPASWSPSDSYGQPLVSLLISQAVQLHEVKSQLRQLKGQMETQTEKVRVLEGEAEAVRDELGASRASLAELNRTHSTQGSHFVRWGRSTCPKDSSLVYSGYTAGTHYSHSGGGANYLCATKDPVLDDIAFLPGHGVLNGVAYYITGHVYTDALCAVCVTSRAVTYMLPGTNRCPGGSVAQYDGYLTSGNHKLAAPSEYVCLDKNPEDRHGSQGQKDSGYQQHVKAHCGSLPCPPYEEGKAVTCVVCSL